MIGIKILAIVTRLFGGLDVHVRSHAWLEWGRYSRSLMKSVCQVLCTLNNLTPFVGYEGGL